MAAGSGVIVGAAVEDWLGWFVGYYAWVVARDGLIWGILLLASLLLVLIGSVVPLTVVRFFGDRADPLGGEPGDHFMAES